MQEQSLKPLHDLACETAQEAGRLLCTHFGQIQEAQIEAKRSAADHVSVADRESEELIRARLTADHPHIGFMGEESAETHSARHELVWVVDPLDGTSNYLCGLPLWSVSIALCDRDLQPLIGVVHAPLLSKLWSAIQGQGALANGKPMHVRTVPRGGGLFNAMLATGFPYDLEGSAMRFNIHNFGRMQRCFHKIRRLGSAAIDLAYIAEGVLDGMWELMLSAWDTAAGILLVSEAGGYCSRFDGSDYTAGDEQLLAAATPELLALMQNELQAAQSTS